MRRKLLALAISLGVTALFLEVVLRLVYGQPPRWIEPQVRHHRSPLLGWVLPVSHQGSYTIDAPVRTNSLGIRDDELPIEKTKGERRVLCLGDSFTFALGVRFEDLYVQKLERLLNERHAPERFQAINAGVAGYNTRQELLYLLAQGLDLEPDLITVGFYWNDVYGNDTPLPDLETTPVRDATSNEPRARHTHTLPPWLRDWLRRSLLLYTTVTKTKILIAGLREPRPGSIEYLQWALLNGETEVMTPYWRATEQRLLEIAAAGRERDIPVILMVFPMENQLHHELPSMVYAEELQRIWAPTGQPFIELVSAYEASLAIGENPFLPYDLHPNALGMEIAAEAVYDVILAGDLLDLHSSERSGPP